jgi:DNA-binding MurR/RpiR family transcriptional regulator
MLKKRAASMSVPVKAPKPKNAAEFEARLLKERHRFTRRMLEAGGYVIENPQDVAFSPVSSLAQKSGLPATSFVRLAQAMGFAGFSEMQKLFLAPLRAAYPSSLQERIRHSSGEQVVADPNDVAALGRSFAEANIASLGNLAERLGAMPLDASIDLILAARVVYVIGIDRSHAAATYLAYALNRAGIQAVQMVGLGHLVRDHAANMHAEDLLIAISFPPYADETVAVADLARERGNAILAVTNSTVSPITEAARAVLVVNDAELHGFRSGTAVFCLLQTLMMGLAYRRRQESRDLDMDDIDA